jgi:hypothetical protein
LDEARAREWTAVKLECQCVRANAPCEQRDRVTAIPQVCGHYILLVIVLRFNLKVRRALQTARRACQAGGYTASHADVALVAKGVPQL